MWPFTACNEFLVGYQVLVNSGLLKKDRIPNISKISKFLESKTGFRLRPASGLCPAREFLACLAFRVFPCTLYMRHWSRPGHSPEPDLVHEILGHVPMFLNQVNSYKNGFENLYLQTVEFSKFRYSAKSVLRKADSAKNFIPRKFDFFFRNVDLLKISVDSRFQSKNRTC